MSEASEAENEPTIVLPVWQVSVQRDLAHIATEVFEHELPILDRIHGEGAVKILDKDYHALEIPADAQTEYLRLVGKYDRRNAQYVERVYPNAEALAAKVKGLAAVRGATKQKAGSSAIERKPERPKAAAKK